MGVDIEAIRRKVAELEGNRKQSNVNMWKPAVGEYQLRVLPWTDVPDGMPFHERHIVYLGNKGFLSPKQFGQKDPHDELLKKLWKGSSEDKDIAKQIKPKVYAFVAVIDRADEDKGVQIWKVSKFQHSRLLSFFYDADIGDYTDLKVGFDLKVKVTQKPGKKFLDFEIDAARKQSPASTENKRLKTWLDGMPKVDDLHPHLIKTPEQVQEIIDAWLSGEPETTDDGSTKGGNGDKKSASENLDDLANEVSQKSVAKKTATASSKATKVDVSDKEDDATEEVSPRTKTNLDDAFDDLMKDD